MNAPISKPFIFTIKANFKELNDTNKLFEYFICLQQKIRDNELYINEPYCCYLSSEENDNVDSDKLIQYKIFNEYLAKLKYKEDRKEYLKILRERETELIEYLNTLYQIK